MYFFIFDPSQSYFGSISLDKPLYNILLRLHYPLYFGLLQSFLQQVHKLQKIIPLCLVYLLHHQSLKYRF